MGRPPCCDKTSVKRGLWTPEEDAKILAYVATHGTGNWTAVPKKAGLKRCGKSCRLRWTNYLRPDLKHESFTPEEEDMIITLHATIGSRWSIIANQLPGRTDNDVKNYWNTKLRKKLFEMGIDPVTHKPFSKIIADYESINLPRTSSNIGYQTHNKSRLPCLNRDLKNAFIPKAGLFESDAILIETNNRNPDSDLLSQLQSIKLVTEASNGKNLPFPDPQTSFSPKFLVQTNEQNRATSSTDSSAMTTADTTFNWNEFLLFDDFFSPQQDIHPFCPTTGFSSNPNCEFISEGNGINEDVEIKGTHGYIVQEDSENFMKKSFVEEILDRDREILFELPDLMGESFGNY